MNLIPSVGYQLGKRILKIDGAQRERALRGIREAVAVGYVGFMSLEEASDLHVDPSADPERNWRVMVNHFRGDGPKRLGVPTHIVDVVEQHAEQSLVAGLRESGILGWRTGRKALVGRYYGFAGIFLRAGQTDYEAVQTLEGLANILPDQWPYAAYVEN